ncbi:hypothetical protein EXU30_04065 [Shewanella maritima]|uniref:Uncharacterized protein n=1 Tax=Shewanella maritima TaxID=2520507 RepID=A0A411PEG4_9GAMM|nr:hypothetical protein [Shewanella maritima]QBF81966.1 hypothetical protein EXU30_04065 [Shewanella maritima]
MPGGGGEEPKKHELEPVPEQEGAAQTIALNSQTVTKVDGYLFEPTHIALAAITITIFFIIMRRK